MQPLDQDQQNSKKTNCRLPIIIFPLTPKGFISPESFLNFFLNLYVYSNMLAEKFQIYRVKIIANTFVSQKIESVQFYSYLQVFIIIIPQAAGDCPFLRNSVFWKYFLLNRKRTERLMELKKLPKLTSVLVKSFNKRTVSRTGTDTDQNFIIGCRYFLKNRKLPVQTKALLFAAGIFLVIFCFLVTL